MSVSQQRVLAVATLCLLAAGLGLLFSGEREGQRLDGETVRLDAPQGGERPASLRTEPVAMGARAPVPQADQPRPTRTRSVPPPAPVSVPGAVSVSSSRVAFSGRALLLDGTPVTFGRVVALSPLEGEARRHALQPILFESPYKVLASAPLDHLGRFRLEHLEPGTYDLAVTMSPMVVWATQLIESPPGVVPVDVPFDATLVELVLPDPAGARSHPAWDIWCRSHGATSEVGPAALLRDTAFGGTAGHTQVTFDATGVASLLLPSGPGYFLVATPDRAPDRVPGGAQQLAASLEAGVPSGVVRLSLTAEPAGFGRVDVFLAGAPLPAGVNLLVLLRPPGGELDVYATTGIAIAEEDRVLPRHGRLLVPPGTYAVRASMWALDVSPSPAEITVIAGRVQRVDVLLSRMGTLAVEIEAQGAGEHARFVLERWNEERDLWLRLTVHSMSSRGKPISVSGVPVGRRGLVTRSLPGGSMRVRLRRKGWRTEEATVTIRPGELVVWRTIVERSD